jgi:hypothetical protein
MILIKGVNNMVKSNYERSEILNMLVNDSIEGLKLQIDDLEKNIFNLSDDLIKDYLESVDRSLEILKDDISYSRKERY